MRKFALMMIAGALSGCGNKGPLYLPPEKVEMQPRIPAAAPEIAPDSIPERRPVPSEAVPPPK
jgi:predicted small lipoprotein YifL